jgi:sarcosine oxidase subunit alpha
LIVVDAARTVLATGAYDRPPLFPNNDLPGIYSARALLKLVNRWGVRPGDACLVLGANDAALLLADRLHEIGVRVLGLVAEEKEIAGDGDRAEKVMSRGTAIFRGYRATRARGIGRVNGLRLESLAGGEPVDAACDIVAAALPPSPSWELAAQAGATVAFDAARGGFVAGADAVGRTARAEVFVTGEMLGASSPASAIARGRIAGLAAALDLHPDATRLIELRRSTEN